MIAITGASVSGVPVGVTAMKVAEMVWFCCTLVNVYAVPVAIEIPSTTSEATS